MWRDNTPRNGGAQSSQPHLTRDQAEELLRDLDATELELQAHGELHPLALRRWRAHRDLVAGAASAAIRAAAT